MTKRDDGKFARRDRDFYPTPAETVYPLLPRLTGHRTFAEPMCGDGAIVRVLEARGWVCTLASDIEPTGEMIGRADARDVLGLTEDDYDLCGVDCIVSNPPWPRKWQKGDPTVSIIRHLMAARPTWLLLSADFAHNTYALPLLKHCLAIVSVGRVSWMGNGVSGFDNAAWHLFDANEAGPPAFFGCETTRPIWHPDIAGVI